MDRATVLALAILVAPVSACLQTGKAPTSVNGPVQGANQSKSADENPVGGFLGGLGRAGENSVDGFVKGLGRIVTTITSPKTAELERLVEMGQLRAADDLYGRERSYFVAKLEAHKDVIDRLADGLSRELKEPLLLAINQVKSHAGAPITEDRWPVIKQTLAFGEKTLSDYREYNVLKERRFKNSLTVELTSEIEGLVKALRANANEAFANYDVVGKASFFDVYPVELPREAFTQSNVAVIVTKASAATYPELLALGKKYRLPPEGEKALSKLYFEKLSALGASAQDFYSANKFRQELRQAGQSPEDIEGLRVRAVDLSAGDQPFPLSLKNNAEFRSLDVTLQALGNPPAAVDYLIAFRASSQEPVRKIVARKDVSSQYISGYRRLANPEYEQARVQYLHAEQARARHELDSSLNPSATVAIALMRGILAGRLASRSQELFQQYQSTPATTEEPVYADYRFKTSTVLCEKAGEMEVAIIDYRNKTFRKTVLPWEDRKTFNVAFGIHEQDRDRSSHERDYATEDDVDKYEKAGHEVALSDLLAKLLHEPQQFVAYSSIHEVFPRKEHKSLTSVAALSAKSSIGNEDPALAAKLDSVVIVRNPNGGIGSGFFVAPDLVITNHHVVEGARFAEIKLRNGMETVGRVVKSDAGTDLALLKVADTGKAVSFHSSGVTVGASVEVVGHPRGLTFSMTRGIVSAVRSMKNPLVPGSREMLVIQTDAPINPGNSGGPLYLDGKVIGVNTQKLTAKGIEGLGFAVHLAEVVRFLQE